MIPFYQMECNIFLRELYNLCNIKHSSWILYLENIFQVDGNCSRKFCKEIYIFIHDFYVCKVIFCSQNCATKKIRNASVHWYGPAVCDFAQFLMSFYDVFKNLFNYVFQKNFQNVSKNSPKKKFPFLNLYWKNPYFNPPFLNLTLLPIFGLILKSPGAPKNIKN